MEVHHHPQVKEKKFKEYFLEFIMISLVLRPAMTKKILNELEKK